MTRGQVPDRARVTLAYADLRRRYGDDPAAAAAFVLEYLYGPTMAGTLDAAHLAYVAAWRRLAQPGGGA